jgi:hypothetical protein
MHMKRAVLSPVVCFVAAGFAPQGSKGKQGATKGTFNRPTDVAFLPNSNSFVTGSYGNSVFPTKHWRHASCA